jgi:predicted DNA-binding helix-hairpin-helix protein
MKLQVKSGVMEKLAQMGDLMRHEPVGDAPLSEKAPRKKSPPLAGCVSHVTTPKGKKAVLKAMMTTACEKNCNYCAFRAGRSKMRRDTFSPDQMARAFDDAQRAKLVDGLFLSSGVINGGVTSQDKVIDAVEIVRKKYQYQGYIHLKIMPGAEIDQIRRAMVLADRISINLEAPTQHRLNALAPKKDFEHELLERMLWAGRVRREMRQNSRQKLASLVTQFVVGAVGDTDLELLSLSDRLYHQIGLKRAYYAAFNPVIETPFENYQSTSPLREFRLYQSSFLLRDYRWDVEDLPFEDGGNLRLDIDPKRAWADLHLLHAPVEVMTANRHQLLRVPGIGPISADAILKARRRGKIRELIHLQKIGIHAPKQAAPYILLDGRRPPRQLKLF